MDRLPTRATFGLLLAGGLALSSTAVAERPAPVGTAIDRLTSFSTMYKHMAKDVLLQVDVDARMVSVTSSTMHIHWDGSHLTQAQRQSGQVVELPQEWSDRIGQVWDEWRAGFPNTTITDRDPREVLPDREIHPRHEDFVEVDLPFAWDDPWIVLVRVGSGQRPGGLTILDETTRVPVLLGNRRPPKPGVLSTSQGRTDVFTGREFGLEIVGWSLGLDGFADVDVPLSPGAYGTAYPDHGPQPTVKWHDTREQIKLDGQAGPDHHALAFGVCNSVGQTITGEATQRYTFPVGDAERVELGDLATARCPVIELSGTLSGIQEPGDGQQACFQGTWSIIDTTTTPETLLGSVTVPSVCTTAPLKKFQDWPLKVTIPPGTDLTGLELRGDATTTLHCVEVSGDRGTSQLDFGGRDARPTLRWPGCHPDWQR